MRQLFLCILFLISSVTFAETTSCNTHQCVIIVDAGSTGTRAHLYLFDRDETHTPIHIQEVWSNRIKPGFATVLPDVKTIGAYIDTLLSQMPVKDVPVYFYATGGMRRLPISEQAIYFNALHQWFTAHPELQLVEGKTITGNEEALYDWLSVNYHLGTLQSSDTPSIGVMDMGGASVQIAFPIYDTQENPGEQVALDVYGKHIELFVYSGLGLGQTQMSQQFLNAVSCFSNHYPMPDGASGQGDAGSCAALMSAWINATYDVAHAVQPTLNHNPVNAWYAIGGISNLATHKLFHFEQQQLTNENLLQQADSQACHQDWQKLHQTYPDDAFLYLYCFLPAYYDALMVEGYGIRPGEAVHYIAPEKNIDWTVGAVFRVPTLPSPIEGRRSP